jgi:hypothetical protein
VTDPRPARPDWPAGVVPIPVESLDRLGLNADNELFWDGRRVEVRQRFSLSPVQRLGAVIVVAASVAGGIGGLAQGVTATIDFGCVRHALPHLCPAK